MAQTTGATTLRNLDIEISIDQGSIWTDISGHANSIEPGGGERETGEFFTADGDTPIIGAGKRAASELKVKIVYTEGAAEPAKILRDAYKNSTPTRIRYAPKGMASGNYLYTSTDGIVKEPVLPGGEVQSGDPVPIEFTLVVSDVNDSVVA
ncbi:MAG: hypothetical protein ACOYYS_19730 [Chloroflexota bacterium]